MPITKIKTEAPAIEVTLGDLKAGDLFKIHGESHVYILTDEGEDNDGDVNIIDLKTGESVWRSPDEEVEEFDGELILTRIKKLTKIKKREK